jgi:hypothetical protein
MADRMSTEEFALSNMTRSMGRSEQTEQQQAMQRACDDRTMRDIVNDFRNYSPTLPVPKDATTVTPQGAGRVIDGDSRPRGTGWVDPIPLERRDWASMTKAEIEQRDAEWKKEYAARRAAEADKPVK